MNFEPKANRSAVPPLNNRQFKLLVDSVTDYAIYMLDPVGTVTSWNAGAERLKGYKAQDVLGRNFAMFYSLADQLSGEPTRALQTAARAGRFASEGWRIRTDGSQFWASIVIDPIHKGNKLLGFAQITRDISERKESEIALEQALERLLLATESGGIGIWDWNVTADVLLWDDLMYKIYGAERLGGASGYALWQNHLHPDDRVLTEQALADGLSGAKPYDTEFRIVRKDGSIRNLRGTGHVTRDAAGQAVHMVGCNWDITALKHAEQTRDEAKAKFATILENMRGYVFERAMAPDGRIYYPYVSESFNQMLGLPYKPALPFADFFKLISPLDRDRIAAAIRRSARDFTPLELEFRLLGQDGREIWVRNRSSARRLDDGTIIWDGFGTDISVEKRAAEQLFDLTYRDKLTGINNRLGFETALENAVHEANQKQIRLAVFFIDIADFRAINDTLGVKRGDLIILQTAQRLQDIAGRDAIVARIAGDEFAVLKSGIDKNGATDLAVEIFAGLGALIQLDAAGAQMMGRDHLANADCKIEINIGIAGLPDDDTGLSAVFNADAVTEYMKRCDIALYEAKRLGHGQYCHYSQDIDHRIRNRMLLRQSLHLAVANEEFILYYQPILDLQSGEVLAAEALVRWQHPKLGCQPPGQFIPLAEESGLIVPLGTWVLKTSMRQIRQWRHAFGLRRISVNVSAVQFSQKNFVDVVENLLRETGATADMIELELTETTLIDCSPEMLERMNALRGQGFTLAIDDFGTGYSSLKYLSKLPIDQLKIDQCFVRKMTTDSNDALIVRTIVALGKGLNLDVVAEGVETVAQQNILVSEGCFSGQGYLFCRPVPARDFENFVRKTKQDHHRLSIV
jgi:diguanylate cyclase (GGDEF)-like protein/PAS domain S-box-containing protein